ncbi:hypothetical protein CEXT_299981 [Caerostris extrusa]|uniref:Uncharacterized protein n=1 Tax=Caerostris extrusa TaxID=172846 RepID=A0AAV4QN91_CAEEX|nr:hypothetical protein CEXT_299981 [Caerostris extrusa]
MHGRNAKKACGASECYRKLFQLDQSHAKSKEERASKMKDEHPNIEENFEEEEDEDEMESGSSPLESTELYPGKVGIIRLVKLRTEMGNILRPTQRKFPLKLTPNYEQVVPETQKIPEVLTEHPELNTESYGTVPVSRSGTKN